MKTQRVKRLRSLVLIFYFLFLLYCPCSLNSKISDGENRNIVEFGDRIYMKDVNNWDSSPIVLPHQKMVFFTSSFHHSTAIKLLAKRINSLHNGSQKMEEYDYNDIHNPEVNGLTYLYHYDRKTASHIMTSENWMRIYFASDPRLNFIRAYAATREKRRMFISKCCPSAQNCYQNYTQDFPKLYMNCKLSFSLSQVSLMEQKYWKYINYIGKVDNFGDDIKNLLCRKGLWSKIGSSGWGASYNMSIKQAFNNSPPLGELIYLFGTEFPKHTLKTLEFFFKDDIKFYRNIKSISYAMTESNNCSN